jgi:cell division protein FtsQ
MAGPSNPVHKTAAIARSRERRRRRMVMLIAALLIVVSGLVAGYLFWFKDSSYVEINDLTVQGVATSTEEGKQIEGAVRLAMDQMTTLDVKQAALDEELSRFPRVESATIETKFPHSATVTVHERGDGSVFGSGSQALLIATDGTVLGSPGDQVDSLPLIGVGDPPKSGHLEGRALNQALVLGAVPKEIQGSVVQSAYGPDGVKVVMSNGMTLIFGDATEATQKWRAATAIIADPEVPSSSYVDLTVPRRPAIRASEGSFGEAEVPTEPVEPTVTGTTEP